jgi:hypothetical protein
MTTLAVWLKIKKMYHATILHYPVCLGRMDDDFAIGKNRFGSIVTTVDEPCILLHIGRRLAIGPERSVVGFVLGTKLV